MPDSSAAYTVSRVRWYRAVAPVEGLRSATRSINARCVAAVGDIHCTKTSEGSLQPLFAQMVESADIIALAGDLVDYGLPEEAHILAHELSQQLLPRRRSRSLVDVENHGDLGMLQLDALCMNDVAPKQDCLSL